MVSESNRGVGVAVRRLPTAAVASRATPRRCQIIMKYGVQ